MVVFAFGRSSNTKNETDPLAPHGEGPGAVVSLRIDKKYLRNLSQTLKSIWQNGVKINSKALTKLYTEPLEVGSIRCFK